MDDTAAVSFYLLCAGSMFLLTQGIAFFCAGLTSPRSALAQLSYSLFANMVTLLQHFVVGYSLIASSSDGILGWFVGNLKFSFFQNIPSDWSRDTIKMLGSVLLCISLASVASSLLASGASQRAHIISLIVFLAVWLTVVYCPIAYWCWNPNGWSNRLGALDYAGGTAIHCTAGFSALVYSLVLGQRISYGTQDSKEEPYSLPILIFGTVLSWIGWLGFNGGASFEPSSQALHAVINTNLSASSGSLSWMILDHFMTGEWSIVGFCSGIVSGLVTITPGAGYVPFWSAILFGACGGVLCNLGTNIKFQLSVDDPLDIFAVHGIGGLVGTILTGVFAPNTGLIYGSFWQLSMQLASVGATIVYTLGTTLIILIGIDSIPALRLRVTPQQEILGIDISEHGETAGFGSLESPMNRYSSKGDSRDSHLLHRFRQTNLNISMAPGTTESPLLQHLPQSYGVLSSRESI